MAETATTATTTDTIPRGADETAADAAGGTSGWRQVWTVAHSEYRLAIRNRWALALAGLFAIFGSMLVTFSGSAVGPDGADRVVASLTNLSVYLIPLAALAFGYDAVVGRDQEGWLSVVFSLPVSRMRVVVGAFAGRATVLAGATVVGFGVVGVMMARQFGLDRWAGFATFVGGAVAAGLVFLALGFMVSSVAREKTHALGFALLVWLWFVLIHDLLALGAVAAFELSEFAMGALVLANPATVFRVLVLEQLGTTAGGFATALASTGLSATVLVAALVGWIVAGVATAALLMRRSTTDGGLVSKLTKYVGVVGLVAALGTGAFGCFGGGDEEPDFDAEPVAVEADDTCEACGMIVGEGEGQYGPTGQAFYEREPVMFDSVREMFIDQFGRQRAGDEPVAAFVTDYAVYDYEIEQRRGDRYITGSTAPETFVETDEAVYVVDTGLEGAMGVELLPFGDRAVAEEFVDDHGGQIVEYDELDEEFVESL